MGGAEVACCVKEKAQLIEPGVYRVCVFVCVKGFNFSILECTYIHVCY